MYAITGITGKVGGTLAKALLDAGQPVRAIVRDESKGANWAARGCEVAVADMADATALARAFTGATAVFILLPPVFDPSPGYPESRQVIAAIAQAIAAAKPGKVLCLSTIGAEAKQDNLLTQLSLLEAALSDLPLPVTFLRAAWFMENAAWDVATARETGIIKSYLAPLNKLFPMVATQDIGSLAARLIQENWTGKRVVELEGPRRVSPDDLAAAFARALGRSVRAEIVPANTWEELFRRQGMKNPAPRMCMLEGFNEGWIDFKDDKSIKGRVTVEEVIAGLVRDGITS